MAPSATSSTPSSVPSLVEFNFASNLPIKLNATNYPTWCKQIMHLLTANNLVGYVSGAIPCPAATTTVNDAVVDNPSYAHWCRQDNHVSLALLGSCGPEAQIVMSSAVSSAEAWSKLKKLLVITELLL